MLRRSGTTGCCNSLAGTDRPASGPASRFPETVAELVFEEAFGHDLAAPDFVLAQRVDLCDILSARTYDNFAEVDVVRSANESPNDTPQHHI